MSSALAIAGVSAVLRDLLNNGLIDHATTDTLGVTITVSVGPPDRVIPTNGGAESTQLNLFMYQVTPNTGWRNEGLPSRDSSGIQRLSNAPLALNLHYLISAHASEDLHGEILLGYAMQFLHETPVLTRKAIKKALSPSPPIGVGTTLKPAMKALENSGLENQIEQIKITPEYLNTEEISKLWTATQSHLRPTAAYMASVVLIEAKEPTRSPLPVLTIGPVIKPDPLNPDTWYERGVVVIPGLEPLLPTLDAVILDGDQPVAQMAKAIELIGHHLDAKPATSRTILLNNDRFDIHESIDATDPPPLPKNSATSILFTIPTASATKFPVGIYSVSTQLMPPDEANNRLTNCLALILAPTITGLPMTVARVGGTATFTLTFSPALRAGQKAVLLLGQLEFLPEPFATPTTTSLKFVIKDAPVAPAPGFLTRLRIDGIESPIIDRSAKPPAFLSSARITIT
jgi:hypothetical protein